MPEILDTNKDLLLDQLADLICSHHGVSESAALVEFSCDYFRDYPAKALHNKGINYLYDTVVDCWHFIDRLDIKRTRSSWWESKFRQLNVEIASNYHNAFPSAYREHFFPEAALVDISRMESLSVDNRLDSYFYSSEKAAENQINFKIFSVDLPCQCHTAASNPAGSLIARFVLVFKC